MPKVKTIIKWLVAISVPLICLWAIFGGIVVPLLVFDTKIIKETTIASEIKADKFAKHTLKLTEDWKTMYPVETLKKQDDSVATFKVNGKSSHIFEVKEKGTTPATDKVVIFVHGLRGTHWNSIETMKFWFAHNYRVLSYDQRGFGENYSNGNVTFGYKEASDLDNLYEYVVNNMSFKHIIVYGQSNGAATTLSFAEQFQHDIVAAKNTKSIETNFVEEAGFSSPKTQFNDMVNLHGIMPAALVPLSIPMYRYFTSQNLGTSFNYLDNIDLIKQKLMIVHGRSDKVVGFDMGNAMYLHRKKLNDANPGKYPIRAFFKDGMGHIDISRDHKARDNAPSGYSAIMFDNLFNFIEHDGGEDVLR